jgi:spore germination protein YaaH
MLLGLVVALLASLVGPAAPASAEDTATHRLVTGWIPSWSTTPGLAAVEANTDLFGEVSPFWYTARAASGATTITPAVDPATQAAVLASLRARGLAVLPSVADGSAARAMAAVLKDPAARAAHVNQLVDLVLANGYDGIELDYEKFAFSDGTSTWPTTRPAWVAFVTELGGALHGAGKLLALAVPPMYDGRNSSTSGYWVYDYAGIAPAVDSLRIMTYDYSVSRPGPISPLSFLRRTLSYAVTVFPADRIRMGVPAYGRLWTARRADGTESITGTCPSTGVPGTKSFTTATALEYLSTVAGGIPVLRYDEPTGEVVATFSKQYTGTTADGTPTTCVVDHVAWWVDARGVGARLPLLPEFGLAGVAVWHLGGPDADSWTVLRAFAQGQPAPALPALPAPTAPTPPPPPPPPPVVSPSPPVVSVTPSTLTPKPGRTVRVKVALQPKKKSVTVRRQMLVGGKWKTLATKRTSAKGRVTFTIKWPRKATSNTYRIVTRKKGSLPAAASETFTITTA